MLKNPLVRMLVLGVFLLGSATAFYFISPVFVRADQTAGYPTLAYMPTRTPRPATATPEASATPEALAFNSSEPGLLVSGEAQLLLQGEFYAVAHTGRGTVNIYMPADGSLVLRLEDFEVEEGADLHVFLTTQDPVSNSQSTELEGGVDLGQLMGLVGDQIYVLPEGLDLRSYSSVVIWSASSGEAFIAASLQVP